MAVYDLPQRKTISWTQKNICNKPLSLQILIDTLHIICFNCQPHKIHVWELDKAANFEQRKILANIGDFLAICEQVNGKLSTLKH